jgi:hypothetical protein
MSLKDFSEYRTEGSAKRSFSHIQGHTQINFLRLYPKPRTELEVRG